MAENGNKSWTELFRWITPVAVTVAIFILSGLRTDVANFKTDIKYQLCDIETKLFKHLTNEELHIPRGTIVNKSEFDLYQKMRDKQMDSMETMVRDIRNIIKTRK